ncbi:MAG TPA: hypothetical protein VI338_07225 [Nitrososphaera sp.]|nr:hypothetical protein [Nitrososphaera sp.]
MKVVVKRNANCGEMPEMEFVRLDIENSGPELVYNLDTPDGRPLRTFKVIGLMADGSQCIVHVVSALDQNGRKGIFIYGGDGRIRILDDRVERKPGEEHLSKGYGFPILWRDALDGLPAEVIRALGIEEEKGPLILRQ